MTRLEPAVEGPWVAALPLLGTPRPRSTPEEPGFQTHAGTRLGDLTAHDVMSPDVVTLTPLASVEHALTVMREHAVRHLPVVLDDGTLVGLVDDRHVALAHLADGASTTRAVFTLMTPDVPAVPPAADLRRIALLMEHSGCDAVVVQDAGGALLGIVTASDLVRALGHGS